MHYRHRFHAGNFADVFKHTLLIGLIDALNRKDKPWCYVDTHAGAGEYDLADEGATRTGEWHDGIGRLVGWQQAPELVAKLLALVATENPDGTLRHYPGSPRIAQALARPGDRLVLCEKVPDVADALKHALRGAGVAVHVRDGYEAHALLPPVEKRGLTLIDPPFERPDEFDAVAELLKKSVQRFSGGQYAVWYPLKNRHVAGQFVRRVARDCQRPLLDLTLSTDAPGEGQMRACGLLVVNPPFGFEAQAAETLQALTPLLAQGPRPSWTCTPG